MKLQLPKPLLLLKLLQLLQLPTLLLQPLLQLLTPLLQLLLQLLTLLLQPPSNWCEANASSKKGVLRHPLFYV